MSRRICAWLVCGAVLLLIWWILSLVLSTLIIPSPAAVVETLFGQTGKHLRNSALSAGLASGGLFVASLLALVFIFLIGIIPSLRDYLFPFFVLIKSTPALAIAPVLMCFVGIDVWCKVLVASSISFFPLVVGGIDGLIWAPESLLNLARCYGTKRVKFMLHIGWAYSVSGFLSGLKTAAPLSVVGALVAEFVAGGRPSALGMFILTSHMNLQKSDVFAGAILACILGLVFFGAASLLKDWTERKLHLVE